MYSCCMQQILVLCACWLYLITISTSRPTTTSIITSACTYLISKPTGVPTGFGRAIRRGVSLCKHGGPVVHTVAITSAAAASVSAGGLDTLDQRQVIEIDAIEISPEITANQVITCNNFVETRLDLVKLDACLITALHGDRYQLFAFGISRWIIIIIIYRDVMCI